MLVGVLLALGCGCQSLPWAGRLGKGGKSEVTLDRHTVAGQVESIHAVTLRAKQLSPQEAERICSHWQAKLTEETALPVRLAVVESLGKMPPEQALSVLEVALQDSNDEVRCRACRSLAAIADLRAMDLLIGAVRTDQSTEVRLTAARGLGHYRDPQAISALGGLLDDRDPAVQYLAMQSLHQVTGGDGGQDVRKWKRLLQTGPPEAGGTAATEVADRGPGLQR